jgi:hypothetical protein
MKDYYYNLDDAEFFSASGEKLPRCVPELCYQEHADWRIFLRTRDNLPRDFTGIVAWSAAVDCDFKAGSAPMCRTLAEGIFADAATGAVTVRLDAATAEFLEVVDGSEHKDAHFELCGINSTGDRVICLCFKIAARMTLDPDPEVDVHTPDTLATKTYTALAISGALVSGSYVTSSGARTIAGSVVSGAIFSGAEFDTVIGSARITATSGGVLVSASGAVVNVASGAIVASGASGESVVLSGGEAKLFVSNGASVCIGGANPEDISIYSPGGDVSVNEGALYVNGRNVSVNSRPVLTELATEIDSETTSASFDVLSGGTSYIYTQPLTSLDIASIGDGCRAEFDLTAGAGFDLALPPSAKRLGVSSCDSGSHYLVTVNGARVVVVPYETGE